MKKQMEENEKEVEAMKKSYDEKLAAAALAASNSVSVGVLSWSRHFFKVYLIWILVRKRRPSWTHWKN